MARAPASDFETALQILLVLLHDPVADRSVNGVLHCLFDFPGERLQVHQHLLVIHLPQPIKELLVKLCCLVFGLFALRFFWLVAQGAKYTPGRWEMGGGAICQPGTSRPRCLKRSASGP